MNITKEQKQFFTLLRAGLWGEKADSSLFDESTDWMTIYNNAKKQSSIGIIYEGLLTLPSELRPSRGIFLQWSNIVARIEENNEHLNEELKNVFALYQANGLTPVLLKGQGVALNYRQPKRRQCGDIDVYLGEDMEKANDLLRKEATHEKEEMAKHTAFNWHGVEIENHRIMVSLNAPSAKRFFEKTIKEWYPMGYATSIEGFQVMVPPHEFNAVFLLVHSINHFFSGGLGIRQVTDWGCLLYVTQSQFNKELCNHYLKKTGLTSAAKAFGAIAVEQLGLPIEALPFTLDNKDFQRGEWLLNYIWEGGNFGFYRTDQKPRPKGYWAGKWWFFTTSCGYCKDFFQLAPSEAFWCPIRIATDSIKMQIKHRKS